MIACGVLRSRGAGSCEMNAFRRFFGHLRMVMTHKFWVFRYSLDAGIPLRGLLHDISKFSPTELSESVRHYSGVRSPIRDARAMNQYSTAWLHHRGRNPHHFEYWVDNTADGGYIAVQMSFPYVLELVCDRLGAARAYLKKDFSMAAQLERVALDIEPSPLVHPQTKLFVRFIFEALASAETRRDFRKAFRRARDLYRKAEEEFRRSGMGTEAGFQTGCTEHGCSAPLPVGFRNNGGQRFIRISYVVPEGQVPGTERSS